MNFFEKAQARAQAQTILGLTGHPSMDDIRAAYRKLALDRHPDRATGTDDEFAQINAAYTLLKEDKGYTVADSLRPAPDDKGATTFKPKPRPSRNGPMTDGLEINESLASSNYVAPRRLRTAMTARIFKIDQSDAGECRTLLEDLTHMAEPDPDEKSLRASILNIIKDSDVPYVPHTNHLPFAIRQSGRRISYMINEKIEKGVNRVAVPTGVFSDNRKVMPIIIRFKADDRGAGTHLVAAATLAESFPGAKCVRVHFGLNEWPEPALDP